MEDQFELSDRLRALDENEPRRRRNQGRPGLGRIAAPLALIGVLGGVYYLAVQVQGGDEAPLGTAEPDPWQGAGSTLDVLPPPAPPPANPVPAPIPAAVQPEEPPVRLTGPSEAERALLERLAAMEAQLATMGEGGDQDAGSQVQALLEQLDALRDETDKLRDEAEEERDAAREAQAEARSLRVDLSAAEAALAEVQLTGPAEGSLNRGALVDPDAARLAALEDRREEAEAIREARVTSPMIAFGGSAAPSDPASAQAPDLGPNEEFLRSGARAAEVEQAAVIAHPSWTVIQGTVIQAALETAIDSSLPGAIRAVVSEDVHSFDGTRVLIPRGSRLIGRYNSQLDVTQRRILIAWDRIVTPDGQSVTISAYGADELGRSGTTGVIDRRLGTRFGSAALVSLISALPQLAAAGLDDPLQADIAMNWGDDAEDAAASALTPFLSVPPIITVDQGARITVFVDRDLELP